MRCLIEIGDDMGRFGYAERLAAWTALRSGNNESAGKCKSGSIRKRNLIIRFILYECAKPARMNKRDGHRKRIAKYA